MVLTNKLRDFWVFYINRKVSFSDIITKRWLKATFFRKNDFIYSERILSTAPEMGERSTVSMRPASQAAATEGSMGRVASRGIP